MSATIKSTNAAAKDLGISRDSLARLHRAGIVPAEICEGRLIRFDVEKVRAILAKRAKQNHAITHMPIGMVPVI